MYCLKHALQHRKIGLLNLPIEILREIVILLSTGSVDLYINISEVRHPFLFHYLSNEFINSKQYLDLLSLSSTCQSLRILLNKFLFSKVSLVRCNEIDVLMSSPNSLKLFSDEKKFHKLVMKETLEKGFKECYKFQYTTEKHRNMDLGDVPFKSTYESIIGFHNYTTDLECTNYSIRLNDFSVFKNIRSLKILDKAVSDVISVTNLHSLKELSVNIATLMNFDIPSLKIVRNLLRLNLLLDFNEIESSKFVSFTKNFECMLNLEELNIFVNNSNVFKYNEMLDFLQTLLENSSELRSINFRLLKGGGSQEKQYDNSWSLYNSTEPSLFIELFNRIFLLRNLKQFGIDLPILDSLSCSVEELENLELFERYNRNNICITLIDKSFSTPRFKYILLKKLKYMILCGQTDQINFQYGEVIDQCHIQALNSMKNLIEFLATSTSTNMSYCGIKSISIEKCWSISDETLLRDYYQRIVYEVHKTRDKKKQLKLNYALNTASPVGRVSLNSPRYRNREMLSVTYDTPSSYGNLDLLYSNETSISIVPILSYDYFKNSADYFLSSHYFWEVELILLELEYYCVSKKKLSSIWD